MKALLKTLLLAFALSTTLASASTPNPNATFCEEVDWVEVELVNLADKYDFFVEFFGFQYDFTKNNQILPHSWKSEIISADSGKAKTETFLIDPNAAVFTVRLCPCSTQTSMVGSYTICDCNNGPFSVLRLDGASPFLEEITHGVSVEVLTEQAFGQTRRLIITLRQSDSSSPANRLSGAFWKIW